MKQMKPTIRMCSMICAVCGITALAAMAADGTKNTRAASNPLEKLSGPWTPPQAIRSKLAHPPAAASHVDRLNAKIQEPKRMGRSQISSSRVLNIPVVRFQSVQSSLSSDGIESTDMAVALAAYQQTGGGESIAGREVLSKLLKNDKTKAYHASILIELSDANWRAGAWGKSLDNLEDCWRLVTQQNAADLNSRRLVELTLSRLLHYSASLGRKERVRFLLAEALQRKISGDALPAINRAQEVLWLLDNRAEQNIFCGFSAANDICVPMGKTGIFPDIHDKAEGDKFKLSGVSLWDIAEHSAEAAGNLRCVKKVDPNAPFAFPSVIHWKFGHFSAITEAKNGKLRLKDAPLKFNSWVEPASFADEASGYALIPGDGPLPAGYRLVFEHEARTVTGRHCVHEFDDEGCDPTTGNCPQKGMAGYSLNLRSAYHILTDTPLSYATRDGVEISFTLRYLALPPGDASSLSNTYSFGPSWFAPFAGGAIELKGTGTPNTKVHHLNGAGSYSSYNHSAGNNYVSNSGRDDLPEVTYLGSAELGYRVTYSDGSYANYSTPANEPISRYLMTSSVDAIGNVTHLYYDSQARLVSFKDHWDRESVISYTPESGDLAPVDVSSRLVRRITDPFGRIARFVYDQNGRLVKIVDGIGIASIFHYEGESSNRIERLTTPYGDTKFDLGNGFSFGFITVTDPRGFKEKVENTKGAAPPLQVFDVSGTIVSGAEGDYKVRNWSTSIPYGDPVAVAPASVNSVPFYPKNENLQWRNSFHWDQKAMYHGENDYNLATAYNWRVDTSFKSYPVLSSVKKTGQGRVWFNYPGQTAVESAITQYNPSKIVRQVENENGTPTWVMSQQTYNTAGMPLESTDERGRKIKINYYSDQTPSSVQALINGAWTTLQSFTYPTPSVGLPATIQDTSGRTLSFLRNNKQQITRLQLTKGVDSVTMRLTYSNQPTGPVPPWPGTSGLLRRIEMTHPDQPSQWLVTDEFTYDDHDRVRSHIDAGGYSRLFDYDDFDRITLVTHPDQTTEQYSYLHLDLAASKDRAGRWTRLVHNSVRQPIAVMSPDGGITQSEWCLCGQLQKLTDPKNRVTKWSWAPGGYLLEKLMPDGQTKTTYTYQSLSGRLSTVRLPNEQGTAEPTLTYSYFVDGRLQKENFGPSTTPDVSYIYETGNLGRLMSVTDGIGNHSLTYRTLAAGMDGAGAQEFHNGPLVNDRIQLVYDWLGRITTRNVVEDASTNNLRSETQTWDNLGRLKSIINTLGSHIYSYTPTRSGPDSVTRPDNLSALFAYLPDNAPGESARLMNSMIHQGGSGQLASHTFQFDKAGRLTNWESQSQGQSGQRRRHGYNLADELVQSEIKDITSNSLIDRHAWGLDKAGNWLSYSRSASSLMETRSFDNMNRLSSIGGQGSTMIEGHVNEPATVKVNGQPAELRADPTGGGYLFRREISVIEGVNTVTIEATDTEIPPQVTNQTWQFTVGAVSRSFNYDDNGNTLSDGVRSYTWDAKNRLQTVTLGTTTWKWDYDYLDRRVREYQNNVLTKQFIWSGAELVQERNGAGVVTRTHYFGGFSDGPVAATGTKYHTLTDHLGNVREVLTTAGVVAARFDYSPYQKPVQIGSSTVTPSLLVIGGYYHHEGSGLEFALYRAYDPELGRWLSEDPLGEAGGLNLYGYVGNSPLMMVDLLGDLGINADGSTNYSGVAGSIAGALGGGLAAFVDGAIPIADPLASAGAYDGCDSGFDFSKGAGAFTRYMWAAYGGARLAAAMAPAGGTGTIAIGKGALPWSPIHVAWGSGSNWVHAYGLRLGSQTVRKLGAAAFAARAWQLQGIPVLSVPNLLSTGHKAATCVTAAASGFARGWWPF